jgi:hypothetical protein
MSKGKIDFIFQRDGSDNYWIKLRSPGVRIERSLGTPDRQLADVLAAPLVAEHKRRLLEARPRIEPTWRHDYAPGREHVAADGSRVFATDREVYHMDAQGVTIRTTTNGGPAFQLSSVPRMGLSVPIEIEVTDKASRPLLAVKTADDAILETYLAHAGIVGTFEREARAVWSLYKALTENKPLKDAGRDDGRKLVTHFEGQGLKSATVTKKIGWLNAAVNLAIKEGKLKFNPFSSIVPKRDDKLTRLPLDDADMKTIRSNLAGLDTSDQVLLRLLGSSGMRLSEAFEIDGEHKEHGCRFVTWTGGDRRRRDIDPQRSHLPDRGQRPPARPTDLVRRHRPLGGEHEPVL